MSLVFGLQYGVGCVGVLEWVGVQTPPSPAVGMGRFWDSGGVSFSLSVGAGEKFICGGGGGSLEPPKIVRGGGGEKGLP